MTTRWWRTWRWFGLAAVPAALLAACDGSSAEAGVVPSGPPAGDVVAMEYDATGGKLLMAYPHALYESGDAGVSWQPVALPTRARDGRITTISVSAGRGALYVAGLGVGVMRSVDEGRTWMAVDGALPSRDVAAFATHADQEETLYAYLPDSGIYRSEDAGAAWRRMDAGPGQDVRALFHSDMAGSMQSGWLFAATPQGGRRSMDCFCGWRPTGDVAAGEVFDIAYDPRQPAHVYAATASGILRSVDGGEQWERVSTAEAVAVTFDASAGALYAAARDGTLTRSPDQGRTWERIGA